MIAVIILLIILLILIYEAVKFKNALKNWLTTGVDCAKNADDACDPIYDIHAADPLIRALNINAVFIRSLFDPAAKQADVKIYSATDPTLAMAGIYYDIDGICWLTFRGTMTGADVTADLNDSQQIGGPPATINSGPTMVHAGMYTLYKELKPKIAAALKGTQMCICGHSLGAALAIYAGFDWPDSPVYAFAPPRTGNIAFANSAPEKITSIINIADIVPTLPWSYTLSNLQYAHVGKIITFNEPGENILDCHNPLTYYRGLMKVIKV
jgi:hypothetical protein